MTALTVACSSVAHVVTCRGPRLKRLSTVTVFRLCVANLSRSVLTAKINYTRRALRVVGINGGRKMTLPSKLSINPNSPYYNKDAIKKVDKVFIDSVHLPHCYAYDIDAGWAMQMIDGLWKPKVYGVVMVTEKQ